MMNHNKKIISHIVAMLTVLSLFACSDNKTANETIDSAERMISQQKYNEAVIELKNGIQTLPDNGNLRFILGQVYLSLGNIKAAEKEFQRAVRVGFNLDESLAYLANIYSLDRDLDGVEDINLDIDAEPSLIAKVAFYKGITNLQLNDLENADKFFAEAFKVDNTSYYGKLANAYSLLNDGKFEQALEVAFELKAINGKIPDLYLLIGQISYKTQNKQASVDAFKEYKSLLPQYGIAKIYFANALLLNKELDEAEHLAKELFSYSKEQPFAHHIIAVTSFEKQEYENAYSSAEKSIQNGFDNVLNRFIAGYSSIKLENYEQAYKHLSILKTRVDKNHPAMRILALVQLRLGYSAEAYEVYEGIENISGNDMELIALASYELLNSGEVNKASNLRDKLSSVANHDFNSLMNAATIKLNLGDLSAVNELENALTKDAEAINAKLMLGVAYINSGQENKAQELIEKWKQEPKQSKYAYILEARLMLHLKKMDEAKLAYERVLEIDPSNLDALLFIYDDLTKTKQLNKAKEYLDIAFSVKTTYIPTLSRIVDYGKKTNNLGYSIEKLNSAFLENDTNLNVRLLLSYAHLLNEEPASTVKLLENIESSGKMPQLYWMMYGDALLALSNYDKAATVFDNWVDNTSNKRIPLFRLINVYEMLGDFSKALSNTRKALISYPNDPAFTLLEVHFLLKSNLVNEAQRKYDKVQEQLKLTPFGKSLSGRFLAINGQYEDAMKELMTAYKSQPSFTNIEYIIGIYNAERKLNKAISFLEEHLVKYPNDSVVMYKLSDLYMVQNEAKALEYLNSIIEKGLATPAILNNTAWLEMNSGNLASARAHIQKAIKSNSNNANYLDTAGMIELKANKLERAKEYFEKALRIAPENKELEQKLMELRKELN